MDNMNKKIDKIIDRIIDNLDFKEWIKCIKKR